MHVFAMMLATEVDLPGRRLAGMFHTLAFPSYPAPFSASVLVVVKPPTELTLARIAIRQKETGEHVWFGEPAWVLAGVTPPVLETVWPASHVTLPAPGDYILEFMTPHASRRDVQVVNAWLPFRLLQRI